MPVVRRAPGYHGYQDRHSGSGSGHPGRAKRPVVDPRILEEM